MSKLFTLSNRQLTDPTQSPAVTDQLRGCLECSGVVGAILSSIDGNALNQVLDRDLSADRLATMNSSLLALAETIATESGQKQCRFVIVENSDGRLVTLRVNQTLLMTCVANKDGNLGMILNISQRAANAIARLMPARSTLR